MSGLMVIKIGGGEGIELDAALAEIDGLVRAGPPGVPVHLSPLHL